MERNEEAEYFDREEDDDDDNDVEKEDLQTAIERVVREKGQLSYGRLVDNGLLDRGVALEDCEVYHGISTKEVRKARREKKTNQYTVEFEKMKNKLLTFATKSLHAYLGTATARLSAVQKRVFGFFLSHDSRRDDPKRLEALLEQLKSKEWEYLNRVENYLKEEELKLARIIENEIKKDRDTILKGAENLEFERIVIGDVIGRNEVVKQCRRQIKQHVMMRVVNTALRKGNDTISTSTRAARRTVDEIFEQVQNKSSHMERNVIMQLRQCMRFGYGASSHQYPVEFDYSLMSAGYKYVDKAVNLVKDLASIVTGTAINSEWKRAVAEDVLDNLDHAEVARRILRGISMDLEEGHEVFMKNLQIIRAACEFERKKSSTQHEVVVHISPAFATQMCHTEALLQSIASGKLELGSEIKRGHRGVVYECRDPEKRTVVAKQLLPEEETKTSQYLALQHALTRFA